MEDRAGGPGKRDKGEEGQDGRGDGKWGFGGRRQAGVEQHYPVLAPESLRDCPLPGSPLALNSFCLTGSDGFPCCGKESVEIVEIQSDLPQQQSQHQPIKEEDEMEVIEGRVPSYGQRDSSLLAGSLRVTCPKSSPASTLSNSGGLVSGQCGPFTQSTPTTCPHGLPTPGRCLSVGEASMEKEVEQCLEEGLQGGIGAWEDLTGRGLQLLPSRLSYETLQLEAELPAPINNVDSDVELRVKADLEMELVPEPEPKPEPEPDMTDRESSTEDPEQCRYTIEPVSPCVEGLPAHQDFSQWSIKSNSSCLSSAEEDLPATSHRSIHVQTSKHLFWADKFIQASEHSLQRAVNKPSSEKHPEKLPSTHSKQESMPNSTLCSEQQLQPSRTQASLPSLSAQPLPSSPCLSSSSLPPAISLAKLIDFASSLAMASSSKMDLPSLERTIKAPSQKLLESPKKPVGKPVAQPTMQEPPQGEPIEVLPERPSENPPEPGETQNAVGFADSCLDFTKPGVQRATIEGEVKLLQPQALAPSTQGARKDQQWAEDQETPVGTEKVQGPSVLSSLPPPRPPQKPGRLLSPDRGEEQAGRAQRGRLQLHTARLTQMDLASAIMAPGTEQAVRGARACKGPAATHPARSGPGTRSPSLKDNNLLPLAPRQLAAFQYVFKLFSSSPTGTVDMRSLKAALRKVGIQLTPQEMCEALRQADLDGDGTVSFKDFLGVLTDNHCFAQCMGMVRNSRVRDPQGLQTLFFEILFKLLGQGSVSSETVQEVMSYYSTKQRALRLGLGWRGPARGHGRPSRAQAGLTFFCQAARLSGLTNGELARSLLCLHRAGTCSPYSQIPNLPLRLWPERSTRNRAAHPDVRLARPSQPSRRRHPRARAPPRQEFVDQPLEYMRPLKLAASPPTLVQKQPSSPSPACLRRPAMRSLYK
ncbi:spermatogenesis-associated protein 32 isoform X2 [Tamandua tetradactyla]|uniref:spermatogenesis-associated protein 32 isoform X2 n=1 Tax=Tamandua tetradactyla TaxID=48850 RepID=UPI004054118C